MLTDVRAGSGKITYEKVDVPASPVHTYVWSGRITISDSLVGSCYEGITVGIGIGEPSSSIVLDHCNLIHAYGISIKVINSSGSCSIENSTISDTSAGIDIEGSCCNWVNAAMIEAIKPQ